MPFRWLFALLLLLAAPTLHAQERDSTEAYGDLDDLLESAAIDGDEEALAARLEDLAARPLDLNSASADEIAVLPGISPLLASAIVRFRESRATPLRALEQLLAIDGITSDEISLMRPFVTFREPSQLRESLREALSDIRVLGVHRVGTRLERSRGFSEGRYPGPRAGLLTRTRVLIGDRLQANLTLENDAGERIGFGDGREGPADFTSAHLALRDLGPVRELVVGDFTTAFGEGLVVGRAGAIGKSREATSGVGRAGSGIRPYGGSAETLFLRGVGAQVALPWGASASAWGSVRDVDASLDSVGGAPVILSISESGLHRTDSELARRGAVEAREFGGALQFERERFGVGIVAAQRSYPFPVATTNGRFRRDPIQRTHYAGFGLFGNVTVGEARLFGELGLDGSGHRSAVGGVAARVGRGSTVLMHVRLAQADFDPVQNGAFAEQSAGLAGEEGVYLGLTSRLTRTLRLNLYADAYRLTAPSRFRSRPTPGLDLLADVGWSPRRWARLDVTLRTEKRDDAVSTFTPFGSEFASVGSEYRTSARVQGTYVYNDDVRLRLRADLVRAQTPDDNRPTAYGTFAAADARWRVWPRLSLDARMAVFDVDAFEARVYAYESDLRFRFSVPAFGGRGVRQYLVARWDALPGIRVEARYAQTVRQDVANLSSGLDAIDGNRARDVQLQVLVNL